MATKSFSVVLALLALGIPSYAAEGPAHWMSELNVKGVDLPAQTIEIPAALVQSYGNHAVQHCYVFPSFAVFETDSGQVGAESIVVRARQAGQSTEDLCQMPRRSGDRFIDGAQGFVVGARGPFLFITSDESFVSAGNLSIFQTTTGKKLFDVERHTNKPLTVKFDDEILSLHYFSTLQLDCDLIKEACWPHTLQKNNIPSGVMLVRPSCEVRTENPKTIRILTPVNIADISHPTLLFENAQPLCVSIAD